MGGSLAGTLAGQAVVSVDTVGHPYNPPVTGRETWTSASTIPSSAPTMRRLCRTKVSGLLA